jgi:hypothetical protein
LNDFPLASVKKGNQEKVQQPEQDNCTKSERRRIPKTQSEREAVPKALNPL